MRVDLYGAIHKGLRALMFETVGTVARTDFGRDEETGQALAAVERLLLFLEEHAGHEDDVVMPELQRLCPETYATLAHDHARTDGLAGEVGQVCARIRGARGEQRVAMGRRLHGRLCALVAEHLRHMEREETDASRVLWAHLSDRQLKALEERIVADIPPARLADVLSLMLPAMSLPERAGLVADLRSKVPPQALDALLAPARAVLGRDGWERTEAAASLCFEPGAAGSAGR